MIRIYRKGHTKTELKQDIEAEESFAINIIHDELSMTFTSRVNTRATDHEIVFSSDSLHTLLNTVVKVLVATKPRNITEYSQEELIAALKMKLRTEIEENNNEESD